MTIVFYIAALVAVISTAMVITRLNAVHALLYMVVSLLSVAVIFFILGAAFVAALEVIVYAGAIMVLFVFVVMMLNLGPASAEQESRWLSPAGWIGPGILSAILIIELVYILFTNARQDILTQSVAPRQVGIALYGPYILGVELAAILLMAGIVGAYHLGRYKNVFLHRYLHKELQ
ncbi:MAG: NADH-quinone oxidoreductase subunit J [Ignavibacteria bacterium]|jgi:NADH-quinone oxidoreductase subunit J|nr:NADH-quinone oxidoreductase subunit J [Ignavibacteria bacterium]MCU7503420.1 NADH-quinone oxidoreductase subunit J [Ignavibacteria bacterium]MCU7516248.1 NADH-quinone oxidoreductase subunit J [Ignavibacteria bacterium]